MCIHKGHWSGLDHALIPNQHRYNLTQIGSGTERYYPLYKILEERKTPQGMDALR